MIYDQVEVEAIKLAVARIDKLGIPCEQVLVKSINYLKDNYLTYQDKCFLEKAMWNIFAYIELGYSYEKNKDELNEVLSYLNLDMKDVWHYTKKQQKIITLNKTNIRNILGRWNPKLHSMKSEDVVVDIIKKVCDKEVGSYKYHSGRIIRHDNKEILWEKTFLLFIGEEESVLYYINKNIYYILRDKYD